MIPRELITVCYSAGMGASLALLLPVPTEVVIGLFLLCGVLMDVGRAFQE